MPPQESLRPPQRQQSPESEVSNYVPSIVSRSYESFNQASDQPPGNSQDEWPEPPPPIAGVREHDQSYHGNQPSRPRSIQSAGTSLPQTQGRYGNERIIRVTFNDQLNRGVVTPAAPDSSGHNQQRPGQVPHSIKQHGGSDRRPASYSSDPSGQEGDPRVTGHPSYPTRQQPPGREQGLVLPKVPRHPFDPADDDDSSEGIDVDAPTPPPQSAGKWNPGRINENRAGPAGQKHPYMSK